MIIFCAARSCDMQAHQVLRFKKPPLPLQEKMPEGLNLKIIQKSSTPYLKDQASTQTLLFEVPEQKFQNFLNTLDQVLEISHDSALLNQYRTEFSQRQSKTHVYRYCIEGCYLSVREFRPGQRYSFPGVRVCCYEEAKAVPP